MSTYSDLDREWYHDLEAQHDEFVRQEALDHAERLREPHTSFALRGVGAAGESTGAFMPEGRERHAVDAAGPGRLTSGTVSACSPVADPFLHWPEHDRAQARERAEALRGVSEPVCMERIRPARQPDDDGLDFARGVLFALAISVPVWALLAGLAVIAW